MRILLWVLAAGIAAAQPLKLAFQCTDDDIASFGLTCSEDDPCPVYLEISAVEAVGVRTFAIGNIHTDSATLYSVLLASEDGGKTWKETFERVRGAVLDQIRFVDFENGWISGQLIQPLPHDPFVLITSDGGKTWRRRPLFDDARPGAILEMWFSSRTEGAVVVDKGQSAEGMRYELYESPSGGESWLIKEAAERPMRLKRALAAAAAPGWRARADGPSRSLQIEKREASKWASVSSFALNLEACKPAPARAIEPPPEPAEPPPVTEFVFPDPDRRKSPPKKKK
jgi:hypothetical protein